MTEAVEDFLRPSKGRPPSFDECRELSGWNSSEMEVRVVVVLAPVDAATNAGRAPLDFELPLTPEVEK